MNNFFLDNWNLNWYFMIKFDCNIIVNKLLNDFVNFYQYRDNFFELDNLNLVNEFFNI